MADKPSISNLKHLLTRAEFYDVIESDGRVVPPSSEIFAKISSAMESKYRLNPKYIYTIIKMNRYSVLYELLQERHIEMPLNVSVANSSVDSVNNEKITEFEIDITDVWDKMQPEEVHYRLKGRAQRSEYKLKRNAWTSVLFEAIFNKTRLPCPLSFKSVKMSESGFFATVVGNCSQCQCSFFGKIVHAPREGEKIIMECTITDFDADTQHNKKRHLKGQVRETVAQELVDNNMLPCMWRRKKADELMKFGDDEPPHLYSSDVLRRAKLEYNERELGLPTKDLYNNLQAMKYDMKYEGAIHSIGLDPIYVHYWTKEQIAIFEQYPMILYIDATGSVMKKVLLPNGELCSHVYLYQAVSQVGDKTVPIFQMVSAVQNTNAISHWLNEFLRIGAMQKASFPTPKEVITDFDKALLGAVSRVFAQKPSLRSYLCFSYELLTGKSNDIPPCLLRIDICHFMNMVARWKCFTGKPARVRQMYLRSMAILRKQETLADLENVAKAIFTLALSQNKGQDSLADRARSTLTECIRASDGKCSVEVPETEEYEKDGLDEKPIDYSDLTGTDIWKWTDKLYKECLVAINNESTDLDDVNGFYCHEFANKLKSLLPYAPLFSEVMRSIYNYGSINATSAAIESEFNDLKNRIFKNVGLPTRIDKFVARHIASFPGKLKLAMAGRYQQSNLSELTANRESVENDLLANPEWSPDIEYDMMPTHNRREQAQDKQIEYTETHSNEVLEVPDVAEQGIINLRNTDNTQSQVVELNEEQNWRNKNDKPNKKRKYTEAVEQTATSRTCEKGTTKKPVIHQNNQLNLKKSMNSDLDKKKTPKKYFRYTDPCPDFIPSDAKFTRLPLMVNAHLCAFIRDGPNTLIISNTCGYDSLCQIFGMAASISDVYRTAIKQMQSDIFLCVNTLLSDGVCAKLYRQRANVLKNLLQLKPEVGRNGVIKINADSTLYNLATYLLEDDPSCVEYAACSICGVHNSRKYPVQTTNYNIICEMGIRHLAQAIDESRSTPKSCCGKIPDVEITYGPHIVCEVDTGKSDKIALCDFPDRIKPSHAQNYKLAGVIGYEGPRRVQSIGHYIAYVKTDSQWVMFNDTAKTKKSQLDSGAGAPADDDDAARSSKRYALDWAMCLRCHRFIHHGDLSECYFAGKGAALVLPPNERARPSRRVSSAGCDIQQHLQSMFYLLRPEETLKMAVKLESVHPGRTRYLVVVSCTGRQDADESCLLGIDCHARATVGLVLRVLADTAITLDGDGGFSVSVCGRQHIFKPVSVQAMWSALQTLHKVSSKAREQNYFLGGLSHDWVSYYEQRIESDRSCLNEWHTMDDLESRRPPSPDSERSKPREREETERVIRSTLKEIMMSVDLDEVTSKYIRGRLEEDLDMDLGEFKPFIDQEMLTILGQMDAPTEIFDHVYLGSEWNASNLEELQKNGVRHILNVTREIDNFFPGMFNYLNVRVYDDEKTDLLKHWDDTFKYITKAKKEGSKVLVHCKMGVSRSASVVIAYAMKAYNWDYTQALKHVKDKRNCIKPNSSFVSQLETYQGILDAMKNKEKLQRSKSDTNLKSPTMVKDEVKKEEEVDRVDTNNLLAAPGADLKRNGQRPKSWSPDAEVADNILPAVSLSQSLERLDNAGNPEITREELLRGSNLNNKTTEDQEARNVLMPCDNGQSYSVSQNKIVHLPGPDTPSVKHRVNELETQGQKRKGLVLNLTNQFEAANSKPSSPGSDSDIKPLPQSPSTCVGETNDKQDNNVQDDQAAQQSTTVFEKEEVWDPGEKRIEGKERDGEKTGEHISITNAATTIPATINNSESLVWTASAEYKCNTDTNRDTSSNGVVFSSDSECVGAQPTTVCPGPIGRKSRKDGDPFSTQLDRVFDREERRVEPVRDSPSRQSSWSSYDSAVIMDNNSVHSSWATLPSRNSSWGSYDMRPSDSLGSSGLFPYDKEEIPWHPGTVKRTKLKLEEGTSTVNKRVCTQTSDPDDKSESLTADEEVPVEAYNPVLFHYAASPSPRRRDSPPMHECSTKIDPIRDPPSPAGGIDIKAGLPSVRQLGRLSTSAPAPSSLSSESDLPSPLRSCRSESETSSPCVVITSQCPSVKHHKMVLESLSNKSMFNKRCLSVDDSPESECPRNSSGIVKNLKKEFEAKSTKSEKSPDNNEPAEISPNTRPKKDTKIRSLPSSPVIAHNESKMQYSLSNESKDKEKDVNRIEVKSPLSETVEDLSVKVLVGKYEFAKPEPRRTSEIQLRVHKEKEKDTMEVHPPAKSRIAPEMSRRSAPIMINHQSLFPEAPEAPGRPPSVPSPSVVVASVVAKAASKKQQQHGRSHPLAMLRVRPRHSSPVYNTM